MVETVRRMMEKYQEQADTQSVSVSVSIRTLRRHFFPEVRKQECFRSFHLREEQFLFQHSERHSAGTLLLKYKQKKRIENR